MKRWLAGLLALGLVVGSFFLGVGPAAAATAPGPNDFTPSGNSARAWMINVLGSVLQGVTPNRWKREQLANDNKFNFSWEKAEAELGMPLDQPEGYLVTNGYLDNPQTAADYTLRKSQLDLKGGTAGRQNRVPTTKMQKLDKTIGVASGVFVGAQFGLQIGKGISSSMGFDVEGGLCSPTFDDLGLIAMLTGTDCTEFFKFQAEYVPNFDATGQWLMGTVCSVVNPANCLTVTSERTWNAGGDTSGGYVYCAYREGTPTTATFSMRWSDGKIKNAQTLSGVGGRCDVEAVDRPGITIGTGTGTTPTTLARLTGVKFSGTGETGQYLANSEAPADPDRTIDCQILGSDGATYTTSSGTFKESEGAMPPPVCPALPPGVTAQNVKVLENSGGTSTPSKLYDADTTPEYRSWMAAYPECETGACKLDLLKVSTGAPVSCFDVEGSCTEWFDDPLKVDNYQCVYGSYSVALSECNVYSGVFKPERLAIGAAYSDPETGEWSGGQASPTAASTLMDKPIIDPGVGRNCWTGGWASFNPVEWVMQPIQCAIEWAFVPRAAVVALEFEKVSSSWDATPPGVLIGTIGAWNLDLNLSGCGGVPISWQGTTVNMLDACPGSVLAPMASTAKPISSIVLVVLGTLAIISIVAGIIGYRGLTAGGAKD